MLNRQMQFKICEFWTLFQFFVHDHGPGARAPHICGKRFFLQIRSPNKYIGKVGKRWFIRYNGFCARYKNVHGGGLRASPALNRVKTLVTGAWFFGSSLHTFLYMTVSVFPRAIPFKVGIGGWKMEILETLYITNDILRPPIQQKGTIETSLYNILFLFTTNRINCFFGSIQKCPKFYTTPTPRHPSTPYKNYDNFDSPHIKMATLLIHILQKWQKVT